MISPQRRFEIWKDRMIPSIVKIQNKYCNRVCSKSDIRQECLTKLFLVVDKIKPGMNKKQIGKFLQTCMTNHVIDKSVKFISAEGHSKTFHKTLRKKRPWQFADKGTHVGVREIDGQYSIPTQDDTALCVDFLDELDNIATAEELEIIRDVYFEDTSAISIAKKIGQSTSSVYRMKNTAYHKLKIAIEDANA